MYSDCACGRPSGCAWTCQQYLYLFINIGSILLEQTQKNPVLIKPSLLDEQKTPADVYLLEYMRIELSSKLV